MSEQREQKRERESALPVCVYVCVCVCMHTHKSKTELGVLASRLRNNSVRQMQNNTLCQQIEFSQVH